MKLSRDVLVIFLIGTLLRFINLGNQSLWIDEALFASWVKSGIFFQEQLPLLFCHFMPMTEFWLRFIFALSGSLLIIVPQFCFKNKKVILIVSAIIAFFPLFVFWSRVARPYMLAGLFVGLAYTKWNKYFVFNFLSLLCTPFALLGFNFNQLFKKSDTKKYLNELNFILFGLFLLFGFYLFTIRPDSGRDFLNWNFVFNAKRLWVIPIVNLLFLIGKAVDNGLERN